MAYIIGVDAGGTKTNGVLYNDGGEACCSCDSDFGNVSVDKYKAMQNIAEVIEGCLMACPRREAVEITVGAAGISVSRNREELLAFLARRFPGHRIHVESDGYLALWAMAGQKDAVLVLAGTGSIVYGKHDGKIKRMGGWGHILGDEGSGYHIAVQAFRRVTEEFDREMEHSLLSRLLLEHVQGDMFYLLGNIYGSAKKKIAGVVPLVVEAAQQGDLFAKELLVKAGKELAQMVYGLAEKLPFEEETPVFCKGGILEKIPIVRETLRGELERDEKGRFCVMDEDCQPSHGAYQLYRFRKASGGLF